METCYSKILKKAGETSRKGAIKNGKHKPLKINTKCQNKSEISKGKRVKVT
jgi:hypothetical protein